MLLNYGPLHLRRARLARGKRKRGGYVKEGAVLPARAKVQQTTLEETA